MTDGLLLAAAAASRPSALRFHVSEPRKFYDDDPIAREPDTQDASKAAEWDIELLVDLATNLFATPGRDEPSMRAANVNTIDEVPDSNWFTNRIGSRPLSVAEAVRGPLTGNAPAPGPWTVISPKNAGAAPGFTMRDSAGTLWFVSFDSAGQPGIRDRGNSRRQQDLLGARL